MVGGEQAAAYSDASLMKLRSSAGQDTNDLRSAGVPSQSELMRARARLMARSSLLAALITTLIRSTSMVAAVMDDESAELSADGGSAASAHVHSSEDR